MYVCNYKPNIYLLLLMRCEGICLPIFSVFEELQTSDIKGKDGFPISLSLYLSHTHTNTDMSYAVQDARMHLHLLSFTLLSNHFSDCSC